MWCGGLAGFSGSEALTCLDDCRYSNSGDSYCGFCSAEGARFGVTGFGRD